MKKKTKAWAVMTKHKRDKIESLLWAGFGVICIHMSMSGGMVDDGAIRIRDRVTKEILDLLDNSIPSKGKKK